MLLIFSILRIADDIKIVKEQQFSLCFCTFSDIIINFVSEINIFAIDALNRIKVVLVEQKKTGKWLAEEVGKTPRTVASGVVIQHSQICKLWIKLPRCLMLMYKTS